MYSKYVLPSLLSIVILSSCSSFGKTKDGPNGGVELIEAMQAFNGFDGPKARELFNQVWNDQTKVKTDRLEAARYLVKVEWRLFNDIKRANEVLKELEQDGGEISQTYVLRSRMAADQGDFDEAILWGKKAMSFQQTSGEKHQALLVYLESIVSKASQEILTRSILNVKTKTLLEETYELLDEALNDRRENIDLSRLRLGYDLLLKKGAPAFEAWKLFFRIEDGVEPHPSLIENVNAFQQALQNLGTAKPNIEQMTTLVKSLAESGFIEYAVLMQKVYLNQNLLDDEILDVISYHQFLNELGDSITKYYQKLVRGKASNADLNDAFSEHAESLWSKLHWENERPTYIQSGFISQIRERFKGLILFNTVSGYYGLHIGQIILDDNRTISQYNQSASFKYSAIDMVLSNGYTSWFSDNGSAVGGWASSTGSFVQVRAGLNNEITKVYSILTDPIEKKKMADQIARFMENEDEMARKNPTGYLPGLQFRMIINGCNRVLDSLKSQGLSGSELRYAFISYMEKSSEEAKIYAHEGRHSIDMKYGFTSGSKNLEYTAKLSEIYFADMPLFMLGTLLGSNIGNGTAHGDANLRVVQGILAWMEENHEEIDGFDVNRPTFPQLDLLTDQQVRTIVRSLDPMAN